jgi:hypothetical protein
VAEQTRPSSAPPTSGSDMLSGIPGTNYFDLKKGLGRRYGRGGVEPPETPGWFIPRWGFSSAAARTDSESTASASAS